MKKVFVRIFIALFSMLPLMSNAAETTPQKVLIVYYSKTSNTDYIAQKLQKKTGADVFRLETVKPYPTKNPARTQVPKMELETGNLPALKKLPADLSSYDLILVGTPVWWYTVSTPVMSFLKQTSLDGKNVAVFCTHEGGLGKTFPDFSKQAGKAIVLDGFDIYKPKQEDEADVDKKLDDWLIRLGTQMKKGN